MCQHDFTIRVRQQARQARARGIRPAVIACLEADSAHAQAVSQQRHGYRLKRHPNFLREENRALEIWTIAEAVTLLRRHAGIGGAAVANLLEDSGPEVRWWLLHFRKPYLAATAHGAGARAAVTVQAARIKQTSR